MSETTQKDPMLGRLLDGLYRVERRLGQGGVGSVYGARHEHLGREVAIKVLQPGLCVLRDSLQRFEREARLLSSLGHPSFVQVFDFGYTEEGTAYLVMERVPGETLRERLKGGPLGVEEVLAIYRPLCEAMGQAHQRGILHRDLKPDNLMVMPGGGVKILDFGMGKLQQDHEHLTSDRVVMGTPHYLAPERARGRRDVDVRSDIFALGAILYELLSGRFAFGSPMDNPVVVMHRVVSDPVPKLALEDPALGQQLDEIIATACAKDPSNRYASAMAMWKALECITLKGTRSAEGEHGGKHAPIPEEIPKPNKMKAGVLHGVLDFVRVRLGQDAYHQLCARFGVSRIRDIERTLPTAWIEISELHRLFATLNELFDDGFLDIMRDVGRYFADLALSTTYKSLLSPGNPETVAKRSQIIFRMMNSAVKAHAEKMPDEGWRIRLQGDPTLSPSLLAASAGWIQRYLEMAGGIDIRVRDTLHYEGGLPVGDILFSFALPAEATTSG